MLPPSRPCANQFAMLNENDVVGAVCAHLANREGYAIVQQCHTAQSGVDIVAELAGRPGKLRVEAKGATSARGGSARFGRAYDSAQVVDRVAKGFYTAAVIAAAHQGEGDQAALAFPDTPLFRRYTDPIRSALRSLRIWVYWVAADSVVTVWDNEPGH